MAFTQEELTAIVDSLIIDNTIRAIDPAKVREVLYAIIKSIPASSDPSLLTAVTPLVLDEFTTELTINQANSITAGYLTASDWNKFNNAAAASLPVIGNKFTLFAKGFQAGVINEGPDIEVNDFTIASLNTNTEGISGAGTFGFFQFVGTDPQDPADYVSILTGLVNIT